MKRFSAICISVMEMRHENTKLEIDLQNEASIDNMNPENVPKQSWKENEASSMHCWHLCIQAKTRPNICKGLRSRFETYAEDLLKRMILLPLLPRSGRPAVSVGAS